MSYQSKTWSLSDEVVAEIDRRVQVMTEKTGSGSPNRVLREALLSVSPLPSLTEGPLAHCNTESTDLDATVPELSSGKGKATVETRGIRPKGDGKR